MFHYSEATPLHPVEVLLNMTSFTIYGHDMQSVSVNTGLVAASEPSIDPDLTSYLINHNNITIAFNTQANSNVGDGDLLMNSWVLDFLNLQSSDTISIEPVVPSTVSNCIVELTFVAYQSQVNWDELPHTGPLRIPYMWSNVWSENYKQSVLERNAPLLLQGCVLHHGSLIAMKVLDSLMVRSNQVFPHIFRNVLTREFILNRCFV